MRAGPRSQGRGQKGDSLQHWVRTRLPGSACTLPMLHAVTVLSGELVSALGPDQAAWLCKVHASTLVHQGLDHGVELQPLGAGGWQGAVTRRAEGGVVGCCHTLAALRAAVALQGGDGQDLVGALVALREEQEGGAGSSSESSCQRCWAPAGRLPP